MVDEDISVTTFRNYLRIDTRQPNPDYTKAIEFLKNLAKDVDLDYSVVHVAPNNPVVIMTWPGERSELPSIMLNSHMDVVPVFVEHWKHDPFSGFKDENGNIFGRGSQDMKCVGIQYLEAIRRLKMRGKILKRNIHVTFVPDEEVGGGLGMKLFVKRPEFQKLNVGFGLDEGIANPGPKYLVHYAERAKWWLKVKCYGHTGHGSRFVQDTAAEKFQKVINKFLALRQEMMDKLKNDSQLDLGQVLTINLTMVKGGVLVNVVPSEMEANFDIRVPPTNDFEETKKMLENLAKSVDEGIEIEWCQFFETKAAKKLDNDDPWWKAFSGTLDKMGLMYEQRIFYGGTDARFVRKMGIPVLGFSPMVNTPVLLHDHDEFLNEQVFLKGVQIYEHLLESLDDV